jgi:hypothetical protein
MSRGLTVTVTQHPLLSRRPQATVDGTTRIARVGLGPNCFQAGPATVLLNVPEKKSRPSGRPLLPRFPNEPHRRRAPDDTLKAKKRQASNVIRLEIERVKVGEGNGLGRHLRSLETFT